MTRQQVVAILGPPDFVPTVFQDGTVCFSWGRAGLISNKFPKADWCLVLDRQSTEAVNANSYTNSF
jgi:hypothetical protein